jgi:YVTN family beta-propeller protein
MRYYLAAIAIFSWSSSFAAAQESAPNARPDAVNRTAGPTATGFLLPNGWHITPVGAQVACNDLPLNILPLKDNRHAIVATSGFNSHQVLLVDLVENKILATEGSRQSWYGLALNKSEQKVWWSGGGANQLHIFDLKDQKFTRTSPAEAPPVRRDRSATRAADASAPPKPGFNSGLLLDEAASVLYTLNINLGEITATGLADGKERKGSLGGRPYDIVKGKNGLLYVSDWAGRQLLAVDPNDLRVIAKIPVGEHPNQIAVHPKDDRLFVACASSNGVWAIDTKRGLVTEIISTSLFPKAPEGSTPDALTISPDGEALFVANADNNCVAVVDIEEPSKSAVKGFIPTGWYPTAVAVTPDGKNLLVGVGKGNQSKPNPIETKPDALEENATRRALPFPYIGTTLSGALSIVPIPDEPKLKEYTAMVYRNCPYSDEQLTAAPHATPTAIPSRVGDPSPIKYVIYVIKENRT